MKDLMTDTQNMKKFLEAGKGGMPSLEWINANPDIMETVRNVWIEKIEEEGNTTTFVEGYPNSPF